MSDKKVVLHYAKMSFYSQKAWFALLEKGIPFDSKFVALHDGETHSPEYLRINKAGKVPVLQHGDKFIPDSAEIIEYLDENFEGRKLQPDKSTEIGKNVEKFQKRLDSLRIDLLTYGSAYHPELYKRCQIPGMIKKKMTGIFPGMVERINNTLAANEDLREVYEQKIRELSSRHAALMDKSVVEANIKEAKDIMEEIETQLASSETEWLCSDEFTIADIILAITLRRFQFIGLQCDAVEPHPNLMKYFAKLQKRETYLNVCVRNMTLPQRVLIGVSQHPLLLIGTLGAISAAAVFGIMKLRK